MRVLGIIGAAVCDPNRCAVGTVATDYGILDAPAASFGQKTKIVRRAPTVRGAALEVSIAKLACLSRLSFG